MIGGDIFVNDMICEQNEKKKSTLYCNIKGDNKLSLEMGFFIVLNCAVSTGPFYIGATLQCGVIIALLVVAFVMTLTIMSYQLLQRTWIFEDNFSYQEIWNKCFKNKYTWVPCTLIICAYTSITMAGNAELLYDFRIAFKKQITSIPKSLNIDFFIDVIIPLVFQVPFALIEEISGFAKLSMVGKIALIVGVSCIAYEFIVYTSIYGFDPDGKISYWNPNIFYIFECFLSINAVFFVHPILNYVFSNLENPTENRCMKIIWGYSTATGLLMLIAGYCAYFMYLDTMTLVDVIYYLPANKLHSTIARFGSLISNTALMNLYIWLNSREVCKILYLKSDKSRVCRIISAITLILFNIASGVMSEIFIFFFKIFANATFIILAYGIPPIFYLKLYGKSNLKWFRSSIFLIAITIILVVAYLAYKIKYSGQSLFW